MQVKAKYSHLNGEEYLVVHKPKLWDEVQSVIDQVDARDCKTKMSLEVRTRNKMLYSPVDMNRAYADPGLGMQPLIQGLRSWMAN